MFGFRFALVIGGMVLAVGGCASAGSDDGEGGADEALTSGNLRATWIYNGPLPLLESPEVFVNMKGHAARVTGLLPKDFDKSKIPFYALPEDVDGRTRITLVYPVASGKPGEPHPNADFKQVFTDPHHTTEGHFGGFPFVGYTGNIGFHGPITEDGPQWVLNRGQVSGGCNRMVGEHVVELAHILGTDMTQPRSSTADKDRSQWPHFNVSLHVHPVQDVVDGTAFDVDFPVTKNTNVELPQVDGTKIKRILKFPTWSADDFPQLVCAFKKGDPTPLPADYCAKQVGNKNQENLFVPFKEVTKPTEVRAFVGKVLH